MMQEVTGWTAVGMAAVANMAVWLKIIYDRKKENGKGNNKNNHYPLIIENKIQGIKNKQAIDAICSVINGIKEDNKEDHKIIFQKLDKLVERMK